MNTESKIPRPTGIVVIAILNLVGVVLVVLGGLIAPMPAEGLTGIFMIAGRAVGAVWNLLVGAGLLAGWRLGRPLLLVQCLFSLPFFPLGSLYGLIVLFYLHEPAIRSFFNPEQSAEEYAMIGRPRWVLPVAIILPLVGLGGVVAVAVSLVPKIRSAASMVAGETVVKQIKLQIDAYYAKNGRYPPDLSEGGVLAFKVPINPITLSSEVRTVRLNRPLPTLDQITSLCLKPDGLYGWLYDTGGLVVACSDGRVDTSAWAWPLAPDTSAQSSPPNDGSMPPSDQPTAHPPGKPIPVTPPHRPSAPQIGTPEHRRLVVIDPRAPLRVSPSRKAHVKKRLKKGETLELIEQKRAWFRVKTSSNVEGWVNGYDIEFVE